MHLCCYAPSSFPDYRNDHITILPVNHSFTLPRVSPPHTHIAVPRLSHSHPCPHTSCFLIYHRTYSATVAPSTDTVAHSGHLSHNLATTQQLYNHNATALQLQHNNFTTQRKYLRNSQVNIIMNATASKLIGNAYKGHTFLLHDFFHCHCHEQLVQVVIRHVGKLVQETVLQELSSC